MSATIPGADAGYGALMDAQSLGDVRLRDIAVAHQGDLFVRQLAIPMSPPKRHAPLAGSVLYIVGARTLKEMVRVATRSIIACMAQHQWRLRQVSFMRQVRHAVDTLHSAVDRNQAVAVGALLAGPFPAPAIGDHNVPDNTLHQRSAFNGKIVQPTGRPLLLVVTPTKAAPDYLLRIAKVALHRILQRTLGMTLCHIDRTVNYAV